MRKFGSRYSFGDFGKMNAATRGYWLAHIAVCESLVKKDLMQALTAAAGVDDLGIKDQKYETVIADANLLQNFQTALNGLKGKMLGAPWGQPLYVDETIKIGNELVSAAIAKITAEKEAASAAAAKAEKEATAAAAPPSAGTPASGSAPPDESLNRSILDEEVIAPPGDNKMFLILGGLGVGLLLLTVVIKKLFSKKKKKKKKVAPELAEDTAEAARRRRCRR